MDSSVVEQAKSGVRWVGIGQVGNRILSMASTIVLARLLLPDDFGTIALARLVLGFILLLSAWGIDAAIIVEEKRPKQIANVAFWINFGIMLVLGAIVIAISPWVENFYATPVLQPILIWMGIGLVFQSFELVPRTILNRELNYKYLTIINLSVEIVTNVLVILLAILGCGVWSLVIPQIIASPLRAVPYWLKTKWSPTLYIERADFRRVLSFGKSILASELTNYVNQNSDNFLIGKFLNISKLGVYSFAFNLSNWPVENIVRTVNTVSLPLLSKIQTDIHEFKRVFLRMTEMISLLTIPIFSLMLGISPEAIPIIFSDKWTGAIIPLQILIIYGVRRSIFAPTGRVFLIYNKVKWLFYINLIQFPLTALSLLVGIIYFDIIGASVAMAVAPLVASIFTFVLLKKIIPISWKEFFSVLAPAFSGSSLFLLIGWLLRRVMLKFQCPNLLIVILYTITSGCIYLMYLKLFHPNLLKDFFNLLINVIGFKKSKTYQ